MPGNFRERDSRDTPGRQSVSAEKRRRIKAADKWMKRLVVVVPVVAVAFFGVIGEMEKRGLWSTEGAIQQQATEVVPGCGIRASEHEQIIRGSEDFESQVDPYVFVRVDGVRREVGIWEWDEVSGWRRAEGGSVREGGFSRRIEGEDGFEQFDFSSAEAGVRVVYECFEN